MGFTDFSLTIWLVLGFSIGFIVYQTILMRTSLSRKLNGQFMIRKEKQNISKFSIILALIWTVFAIFGQKEDIFFAYLFWIFVLGDLIAYFFYKKVKPISIVIDGHDLFINSIWIIKRDIRLLKKINLNGFTDSIHLHFLAKFPITIDQDNYNATDIRTLLYNLVEQSEQNVIIRDNLKEQ